MTILEDQTITDNEIEQEPEKTMAYYEANPDEMPEDIDSINAIPQTQGEIIKEDEATSGDKEKTEDNVDKGGEVDKSTRPPIESKNGKHTLPYGVLENTRNELNDTRTELNETKSRIQDLENESAAAEKELHKDKNAPLTNTGELDIEKLREEYDDDVVDTMVAMHNTTQAALKKVDELSEKFENVITKNERSEQENIARSVQDAIDNVPFIAELQAKGGDDWKTAIAIDKSLRINPLWNSKSYEERYQEIGRQMGDKSITTTEKGDLDSQVDNALRNASGKSPTSISDLDGGDFIDTDAIQSGTNLSVTQIEGRLEDMNPAQLDAWLATG